MNEILFAITISDEVVQLRREDTGLENISSAVDIQMLIMMVDHSEAIRLCRPL